VELLQGGQVAELVAFQPPDEVVLQMQYKQFGQAVEGLEARSWNCVSLSLTFCVSKLKCLTLEKL
jgi:hypothetical protein